MRELIHLFDKFPDDDFGFAIGVHVGRIERGYPSVPRGFEDREGLVFVEDPRL